MGKTSTEVKSRWMAKNYSRYVISLRYDTDQRLIDFIEENKDTVGTTQIIREALEEYVRNHGEV